MDLACSLQPFVSFDGYLDSSEQSHAVPCNETQSDVPRDQKQVSTIPETSHDEFDALNDQIPPFTSLEPPLLFDYLNPEPEDIIWTQVCQTKYTQDYMASTSDLSSLGLNVDLDWNNSLIPPDMLYPSSLSLGTASGVGAKIGYPPMQVSESITSSIMSRSASEALLRKRSRSSHSSSPELDRQHKRLISSTVYQCQWATCHENFVQTAKLRTHARTHASSQIRCLWSGCVRVVESTPELKRHLDSHTKPHICSKCQHQAATARDLSRHTLIHGFVPGTAIYYCPSHTCPYREGGHKLPFGRRDNAMRHINKKHPDQPMVLFQESINHNQITNEGNNNVLIRTNIKATHRVDVLTGPISSAAEVLILLTCSWYVFCTGYRLRKSTEMMSIIAVIRGEPRPRSVRGRVGQQTTGGIRSFDTHLL